jgi:hypothetical protein
MIHSSFITIVNFSNKLFVKKNERRHGVRFMIFTNVKVYRAVFLDVTLYSLIYRYAPHNDVSFNDGPHIRRWSHKIIIL